MSVPPRFVVESLVRLDGSVDLGKAYAVATSLGITDQTLRLATRRMVQEGLFTQEGRGRAGVLRRTPAADLSERHDGEFVHFAYLQDSGAAPWDGRWRLLGLSVPEDQRSLRDRLRRILLRLGGGHLQPGLYVSPHDLHQLVIAECPELDSVPGLLVATTSDLEVGGHMDPREIAASVWDLAAMAGLHQALANEAARATELLPALSGPALTGRALELAWSFDRAHVNDPLLPPELLPRDWAGSRARAEFARAWEGLAEKAATDDAVLFARFA